MSEVVQDIIRTAEVIAGASSKAGKHVPSDSTPEAAAAQLLYVLRHDKIGKKGQIWRWVIENSQKSPDEAVDEVVLFGDDEKRYRRAQSRANYIRSERLICLRALNLAGLEPIAIVELNGSLRPDFDPNAIADTRTRVLSEIVRRQGQPQFRDALLKAYGARCAVTGCTVSELLDAAHIHPYLGSDSNAATNGLLHRTDIHSLFDLHLISVEPDSRAVRISPRLRGTEYESLEGVALQRPKSQSQVPSTKALQWHRSQCDW